MAIEWRYALLTGILGIRMTPDVGRKPFPVSCYICGKKSVRLMHPDELRTARSPEGCILCNYCHRPICLDHLSTEKVVRLQRIRTQHFCVQCGEALKKNSGEM